MMLYVPEGMPDGKVKLIDTFCASAAVVGHAKLSIKIVPMPNGKLMVVLPQVVAAAW